MPIQVPNFTTTASISGATLVSQADEQLNIFMDDVESYVESTYGTVATSLEDEFSTQLALTTAKAQEATAKAQEATTSATSALASKNAASTSATNSANNAGLATTKAQEASASAAAANADKVSAAASAADALASKNAASTSATNSANSATDALSSATNAAISAANAAGIYDMFDDRYLGSKTLDPLVDNDGGALQVGALYFNSTNNSVKVYTGTAWLALSIIDAYTKTESNTSLALKVNNSEKGVANGVATLDVNGKVVLTQIPDSVLGQLEYMGTRDFTTLPTATQKGQYWIASVSGNGYIVGDWAVWNGSAFDKVDNTDAVATVAGRTGNVVLTKSDVGLANVDNTADSAKPVSTAQQTAIDTKVSKVTSTDNAIVRFDGTTGNVQNSGVIIDDNDGIGIGRYPGIYNGYRTLTISGVDSSHGGVLELVNSDLSSSAQIFNTTDRLNISTSTNHPIVFNTYNTERLRIEADGDILMPSNKTISIGGTSNNYFYADTAGNTEVYGGNAVILGTNGAQRLIATANGNLLVGTTTDNGVDKLQVNGSIAAKDSAKIGSTFVGTLTHSGDESYTNRYLILFNANRTDGMQLNLQWHCSSWTDGSMGNILVTKPYGSIGTNASISVTSLGVKLVGTHVVQLVNITHNGVNYVALRQYYNNRLINISALGNTAYLKNIIEREVTSVNTVYTTL